MFEVDVVALVRVGYDIEELTGRATGLRCDLGRLGEAAGAETFNELPAAFTNGEETAAGVVDEMGADRSGALFAREGGLDGEGVFGAVGGDGDAGGGAAGGQKIDVANGDVADGGGFDFAGPTDDEGDTVAALIGVGFLASQHEVSPLTAVFFHVALLPG